MRHIYKSLFTTLFIITAALALNACETTGGGYNSAPVNKANTTAQAQPVQTPQSQPAAQPAPQNANTVKVGILLPLSGPHKALGDAMLKSAQMALFEVGADNLELIPRDTQGTAQGAQRAATNAINAGSQLILGPVFAGSVRAAKPITQNARVNMIAFSTDWKLAGGNTYIMGFLPFDQIERITQYAASQNIRRAGVISPSTEYGKAVSASFNANAPRHGITITQHMNYPLTARNMRPVVEEFINMTNPGDKTPFDAVLMPVSGGEARAIGDLLTENGLPPSVVRRLGTGIMDEDALAREPNLNGAWFAAPSPNARRGFQQRYVSTYNENPPRLASLAFDATALAAVLARRGIQTTGRPAFDQASISTPNGFSGLDGIFRFRPNNTAERGLALLEFKNGRIKVIQEAPRTFQNSSVARY